MYSYNAKKRRNIMASVGLAAFLGVFFISSVVHAVTLSYKTDDPALLPGMVVSLSEASSSDNSIVKRAGLSDAEKLVGISTTIEDSLVTVSQANRPVFVTNEGEVHVYVVDINGPIENGDLLRLSSIKGTLEKAEQNGGGVVIGTALESTDFSDAETYTASNEESSSEVRAKKVNVAINSRALSSGNNEDGQSALSQLGFSLTGKNIGEIRVLIALIMFLLVMIAEGGIIYGAISSAITSLGRNPLAKKIIRQELVRVLFVAILVLAIGLGAILTILFA